MQICHLYIFFDEMCAQIFPTLFFPVGSFSSLSFESPFYILDKKSVSDMCFAGIFSQPVACLFILLTLFSTEQSFKRKSTLSIFPFTGSALMSSLRQSGC